jgi:hypothetical protein
VPLQDGVLIACKNGIVEMTATVNDPHRDEANAFASSVNTRIFDHQYQVMTDPAILNPTNLAVSTCVVSRDPLPPPLKDALISLAFAPIDTEAQGTGHEERSMFSRFQRARRSKLDKWRSMYLRASDLSPKLAELEEALIDEVPSGPLPEIAAEASRALVDAARTTMRLLLAPSHEHLGLLERAILQERAQKKGRLVLHPAAVRAIAAFTGESIRAAAPRSTWSDDPDDDAPLMVEAPRGGVIRSDPEYRVVNFVARGSKEMLTAYMESVLRQSLTAAAQP